MPKPYKLTQVKDGSAVVVDRTTGETLGRVRRRRQTWNLRRTYVYQWWEAHAGGERVGGDYQSRREAVAALHAHSSTDD